jgi:hypothetical protein
MNDNMFWLLSGIAAGSALGMGLDFVFQFAKEYARLYHNRFFKTFTLKNYVECTKEWDEIESEMVK